MAALVSDADSGLPDALRPVLAEAAREIRELEARMREVERSLEALARASDVVVRLRTIPGVGLLTATALVAFVGDVAALPVGPPLRELPRAHAARVVERPAATPRRDQQARRSLPAHAAHPRRPVRAAAREEGDREHDRLRTWALDRERARGHNKAAVALANKLARIVWAVWRSERAFGHAPRRNAVIDPPHDCFEHTTVMAHRS